VDGPWSYKTCATQTDAATAAESLVTKFKDETCGLTNKNKQTHYFLITRSFGGLENKQASV
jgi:hypothetical protein